MCLTVTSDRDEIEKHPTGRPLDGRDFVPSRKHSQEDFSTDSIVRKTDPLRKLPRKLTVLTVTGYNDARLTAPTLSPMTGCHTHEVAHLMMFFRSP